VKRNRRRLWGLILLVGAAPAAFPAANAAAAEPTRVVVVSSGAGDPVAARLIDELIASGVTVEVTAAQATPLPVLGRARAARAVVRVDASRRSVHLWTSAAGPDAAETLLEERSGDPETAARALALRVVEVLRPHLAEADPTGASAAATPAVPPAPSAGTAVSAAPEPLPLPPFLPLDPPAARPAPWPDNLSLYIAPAMLVHPGTGFSPSGAVLWGVTKMVHPHIGLDVCAIVPFVPSEIAVPGGRVKLAVGALGAGGFLRYPGAPSPLTGWLGLGVAAGFVGYDSEAASTAVRASDGLVAHALPYARAAFEWRARPSLGLRADLFAALARPRPVLEIAGHPDTVLEQPLLGFSLGLLVWLP
jgi:hypothetical protein